MLSDVVKSSALIDGIIRNLRDFSADSPGRGTGLFDVNTAIHSAVDLVGAYIRRTTDHFTLELHSGLPRTRGSAQRLEQVFINLILNACQSLADREKAITVRSCPGATRATVRVIVSDEGGGISPEIMPRVREAFFTTREASGGTGLGLYVSEAIVSACGGTLDLVSQPGVGTQAIVTLPAEVEE
jgi:signal transduction histidine kinase